MFGMNPSPSDPMASYEVTGDRIYANQHLGQRGFVAKPDTATTSLTGVNNDLVFTSKGIRPKVGSIAVQYGVIGPNAPLALYENGTPAVLRLATNQGYQLAATFPGSRGNLMSLTLIDPGVKSALAIRAIPPGQIVVSLAHDGTAITTTATDLVNLINVTSGVNRWVTAWVSDATLTNPITALPLTYFKGGMDVPYLVFVSVTAGTNGTVTTTANQVKALMAGSDYVTAANNGAETGATAVLAMGPLPLTGGYLSRGVILSSDDRALEETRLLTTIGQGENHLTNYGLEVPEDRMAVSRTWKTVPQQDRAVIASSDINHAKEHKPRSLFL